MSPKRTRGRREFSEEERLPYLRWWLDRYTLDELVEIGEAAYAA